MSWENKVGELSREEGRGVLFNKLMLFRDLFKAGVKRGGREAKMELLTYSQTKLDPKTQMYDICYNF